MVRKLTAKIEEAQERLKVLEEEQAEAAAADLEVMRDEARESPKVPEEEQAAAGDTHDAEGNEDRDADADGNANTCETTTAANLPEDDSGAAVPVGVVRKHRNGLKLFKRLHELDPTAQRKHYFIDGVWDLDALEEDIALELD